MPVRVSYKQDGSADAWRWDWPVARPVRSEPTERREAAAGSPLDHRQRGERVFPESINGQPASMGRGIDTPAQSRRTRLKERRLWWKSPSSTPTWVSPCSRRDVAE